MRAIVNVMRLTTVVTTTSTLRRILNRNVTRTFNGILVAHPLEFRLQHFAPIEGVPRRIHRFDEEHIRAGFEANLDLEGTVSMQLDSLSHDVDPGPRVGLPTNREASAVDFGRRRLDPKRQAISLGVHRPGPGPGPRSLHIGRD